MPIRERRGGWQIDVIAAGKRVRHQFDGSKRDAKELEVEIRLSLLRTGKWEATPPPPQQTPVVKAKTTQGPTILKDGLPRARSVWAATCCPKYAVIAERNVMEAIDLLGGNDLGLDDFGYEELAKLVAAYRAKGLGDSTINTKLSALGRLYRVSRSNPPLTNTVVDFATWRPSGSNRDERVLTADEERELFPYFLSIGRQDFADLCVFGLDLALHVSEATALKVSDFEDLSGVNPTCHIPGTKTDYRAAPLPMTPRAVEATHRRIKAAKDTGTKYLFAYWREAGRTTRQWARFRDYLGLQDERQFTFKMLRHTCLTRLADAGTDAFAIRDFARHANVKMTERYVHSSRKRLRSLADTLHRGTQSAAAVTLSHGGGEGMAPTT